jgi:hypothetical protein
LSCIHTYVRLSTSQTTVTLLGDGETNTLTLRKSDDRLLGTNDKNVAETSGELVTLGVSDGDNVKGSRVLIVVSDVTDTAHVTTTSAHDEGAMIELEELGHTARFEVNLDSVVNLDVWIRVADGAAIVGDNVWDTLLANLSLLDLAELELSLLSIDLVHGVATLNVEKQTEVLTSLWDGDDVHKTSWEADIGADLTVNEDVAFLEDHLNLVIGEGVFETVAEEHNQWKALTELVRTS